MVHELWAVPPLELSIVGNGPSECNSSNGPKIDAQQVIRFNNCFSPETSIADYGKRMDFWASVFATNVTPPSSNSVRWVFVPAPLNDLLDQEWRDHFQWDWKPMAAEFAGKLTFMPADLYRDLWKLVPCPTTGFAFLYWVFRTHGCVRRDQVFGFDFFQDHSQIHHSGSDAISLQMLAKHQPSREKELAVELFGW